MEKADNVYVSLGDFGWSDLGTWGSLYDLSERDREGNVTLKSHSLIYNGKDNMIVLPKGKARRDRWLGRLSDSRIGQCPANLP